MKLNYITVMVRNMEKSLDFYEKLVGLKVMNKMGNGRRQNCVSFKRRGRDDA